MFLFHAEADDTVKVKESRTFVELLKKHNNVIADVARATGRSRKQVYRWLDKHGLRSQVQGSPTSDLDDETN